MQPIFVILSALMLLTGCEDPFANYTTRYELDGYEFAVKDSSGERVGPNENIFSSEQVKQDDEGIHLRLEKVEGDYQSAEIILTKELGYGTYEFTLQGPLDDIDEAIMVSPFLYADDDNEIDIEFSTFVADENREDASWLQGGNYQYIVQPYYEEYHSIRLEEELDDSEGVPLISGVITYLKDEVTIALYHGYLPSEHLIYEWTFGEELSESDRLAAIPSPKELYFRLNVYIREKDEVPELEPLQITLKSFKFTK